MGKVSSGQLSSNARYNSSSKLHDTESERFGDLSLNMMLSGKNDWKAGEYAGRAAEHEHASIGDAARAKDSMSVHSRPRKFRMDEFQYAMNNMNAEWQ